MDHSGALVKWIWGPYQKSQAESGDRGPGDVGVGLEDDPEFMVVQERLAVGRTVRRGR